VLRSQADSLRRRLESDALAAVVRGDEATARKAIARKLEAMQLIEYPPPPYSTPTKTNTLTQKCTRARTQYSHASLKCVSVYVCCQTLSGSSRTDPRL
jgi:hypothetical protein